MKRNNPSKKNNILESLRINIGELFKIADNTGLHNVPFSTYNNHQNNVKNYISKKLNTIEQQLLNSLKKQEEAYLFLCDLYKKTIHINSKNDFFDLLLNTDIGLLNEKISFADKIKLARNILLNKVDYSKKVLLDIYYIYKTIEMEKYRIGLDISKEARIAFEKVIDKYFTAIPLYATSDEYFLLKRIADAKNFDDAYDIYYENIDMLLDVTFIKVNNGQQGDFIPVDLYKLFNQIKDISKKLYSPFYGGKVNFVSGMTTQRIHCKSLTQRNVSLDSNTVSFIRTLVDGKEANLSENIRNSIKGIINIKNAGATFDFGPYILENYTFYPMNKDKIFKTLSSVEKYFYPNDEWYRLENFNNLNILLNDNDFFYTIKNEYNIGYAMLLSMCLFHFKFNKMTPLQKIEKFCSYMDEILFVFREPFIEIAYNLFTKSNQYRFFKKIQRNAKNITKDLRNMAWDVLHLWLLEANCSAMDQGVDLLVPYFYCFDEGLLELKECFDLDTIFVSQRTGERICFYHKHSYPLELLDQYKTIEKEKNRIEQFTNENISSQIEYLESEINLLW
ncbi:MAG: hypothetical protein J1F32_03080 [Erysipelotrichales bacterium]|nr:hypothetical protein [Erysipelotrichales bacterium]